MDMNNLRPNQGGEPPATDTVDWRTQLKPDFRLHIVIKMLESLQKHLPFGIREGFLHAERLEEKAYNGARSQWDYLLRITRGMLMLDAEFQNTMPNQVGNSNQSPDQGSPSMQPQPHDQAHSLGKNIQNPKCLLSEMPPSSNRTQSCLPRLKKIVEDEDFYLFSGKELDVIDQLQEDWD